MSEFVSRGVIFIDWLNVHFMIFYGTYIEP